ncbi:DNA repair protein RecO [Mycoplasma sp. ES3157-GEN-MYC]|uniref:DNA repair protein RecO n=1 Tax=Mycoplasma miroungigenitalium TaxID=754515 RepID=A0A6M4J8Y0_9MOLU|nr:DNA repair protein RecO [Mycoplasma miroungigenitalium]MBU4690271.1 DNA repair protein RecO [Mycoplasma miroungigenitalium]MBU4691538.1 DNA repair protein RecO [Mycoplasma miroungigenitalium]QJR43370.1 DNA repair protein RecO [Mycoplasma miroungigenitalium]
MAETIEKVIVINISDSPTGSSDGLVDFFGPSGPIRLLAKGINKPESKNRANLLLGSCVEIEYFKARQKGSIGRLKKSTTLYSLDYSNNLNLVFLTRCLKIFKSLKSKSLPVYNAYFQIIHRLGEGLNKRLLLFILAQSLSYFGIAPITSKCCACSGSYDLCDFSYYEGGFLCSKHSTSQRWNKELKSIYYLFSDLDKFLSMSNDAITNYLYAELLDHLEHNGINIEFLRN